MHLKMERQVRKPLQFRDDRMDSRGAGGPAEKSLGLRIIRSLRETFIVNEMRLLLFLERLGSIFKRCRPAFAEAASRRQA